MIKYLGGGTTQDLAAWDFGTGIRRLLLACLTLAITLGPRLPLAMLSRSQRVDLRVEDFIAVLLVVAASVRVVRWGWAPSGRKWLWRYLGGFLLVSFMSTAIALLDGRLGLAALIYWARDFEFALVAFSVSVVARDAKDLRALYMGLVVGAALNAGWVVVQVLGRFRGPLIHTVDVATYGLSTVGEAHPFQAAGVFAVSAVVLLALSLERGPVWLVLLSVSFVSAFGVLGTLSRTLIAGLAVGGGLILVQRFGFRRLRWVLVGAVVVGVTVFGTPVAEGVLTDLGFPTHRLARGATERAFFGTRVDGIWAPIFQAALDRPFIGHGKGSLGGVVGYYDEAHNYFLRTLYEGGIVGLGFLLCTIVSILVTAGRVTARQGTGVEGPWPGAPGALGVFVMLILASIFQDGLYAAKLSELFFLFVGIVCTRAVTLHKRDTLIA